MKHRTRILETDAGSTGVCTCGFVTPTSPDRPAAAKAIASHELDELKKAAPKPARN